MDFSRPRSNNPDASSLMEIISNPTKAQLYTTVGPVSLIQALSDNIRPALLVAVVSVSLSIGLGIASGSTPLAGLRTAIWGGLFCGAFGSSPFNIIGPAGALAGQLSKYSSMWGPDVLPWIAICSGFLCAVILKLNLQKYMLFMPKSVFEGFTVAVAFGIGLKQINYACGLHGLHKHEHFIENVWESIKNLPHARMSSLALFVPETILLFVLLKKVPKIPWMVIVPFVTIIFGYVASGESEGFSLDTLKTEFGVLTNDIIEFPDFSVVERIASNFGAFASACFSVCLVAVLETLISAKIADFRAHDNFLGSFDEGKELRALAGAQVLCGLLGGLPPTGVFVRTSVNQLNGATHVLSQWMNAIFVMIITVATMPVFSYLPLSSVASILVVSSVRMIPMHFLHDLWKNDKSHFGLCMFTAAVGIWSDPVEGLLGGMLIAFLMGAMSSNTASGAVVMEKSEVMLDGEELPAGIVQITGPVTYANGEGIMKRSLDVMEFSPVMCVLDLSRVTEMDMDGGEAVERLVVSLQKRMKSNAQNLTGGGQVAFVGIPNSIKHVLHSQHHIKEVLEGRDSFSTVAGALKQMSHAMSREINLVVDQSETLITASFNSQCMGGSDYPVETKQ
ncbi:hypothetical protein GUITHDRAFT_136674 [Guillardia theta CCMP2712]|uniref:STAS domain-containing protein n=1 Tax=Guillardia theta (strain CCMP2712) TaxID=905079 RepID=L1JKE6_GUITC|nr:hypothetical protein GUITHDRAFT_136674 [Guillardia theta CCMP2712]EKX48565.1 hypothetical protein GUITHDRAFT_136674 [Guillardia theta CCMP2712]|eukprot:XP_005835545.1 hypothetical protein GUITHDRAFT_136674 [Guillardia theta CCMP2712]